MDNKHIINVGSRNSQLALIQTNKVITMLQDLNKDIKFNIVPMTTTGDKILDTALSKIGEKSLFTRELEIALLQKEVDFVVHSLKDLPTELPAGLIIGAICKRDDPRDAVIVRKNLQHKTISDLPNGSRIGTSSLRRIAQLKKTYPHLIFQDIRGNLNTRLKKLDGSTDYEALILAAAGIERMQWSDRITQLLNPCDCMHAVGQGAMAVECRVGDNNILSLLKALNHLETVQMCTAERSFLKKLEGGCSVPVAVTTKIIEGQLYLDGGVFSIDGTESVLSSDSVDLSTHRLKIEKNDIYAAIYAHTDTDAKTMGQSSLLGTRLAEKLIKDGADAILKVAKQQTADEVAKQKEAKNKTGIVAS